MQYSQFFFTIFCQVFFCLGLNKIMEEGQLLNFLRKPFEAMHDEIETKEELLKWMTCSSDILNGKLRILKLKIKYYLAKPFVLCITCFASVWGGSVFITLNGIDEALLSFLIISCVSSAFIQTFIYAKTNI